ncbi:hypothetical protein GCM10027570_10500 [Streptomonospora sediminis]
MTAPAAAAGLRMSAGRDDPAIHEFDTDFAALLSRFEVMAQSSHRTRRRFFHADGTAVRGTATFVARGGPDPHPYFAPGRSVPVFARYSSGEQADEVLPGTRGVSLLFLDSAHPDDPGRSPFNLTLNTGSRLFARDAAMFHRFTFGTDTDKEELAGEFPGLREAVWEQVRDPVSYTRYHYHSQVPRPYVDGTGRPWLARYRIVPTEDAPDCGWHDPGGLRFPLTRPRTPVRALGDDRPPTLLSDELQARVREGRATGLLQIQLRPLGGDAAANSAGLDPSLPWPAAEHPFRTIAELRFDAPLDRPAAEGLVFDPANAPEGLGIALARSPAEPASVNHIRALVYRMTHRARTGAPPPRPAPAAGARPRPRQTVCIIGAGPAGLTAARELQLLGHRTVVLESEPEVGGKSASIRVDGRAYDLGAHICTPQYTELARLAAELGVGTEDATPSLVHDTAGATAGRPDSAFFRPGEFSRYARLRAERFPGIGRPGLAHAARPLAEPVADWLGGNGLQAMAASLGDGYTASGYGHLRGDLPALYFAKYAEMTGLFSERRQLAGHAGTFTIRDGFAQLWRRVAEHLPDVRTGTRITMVERSAGGVVVHTGSEPVHADALVVTPALDRLAAVLDTTADERDIAARIRTVDYYTVVCRVSGLFREGFYLVGEHTAAGAEPGHCVAYHHRYADSDVYTCYLYGADGLDSANIGARLGADVARMGGRVEEVLLVRRWPFMPHFSSADTAAGVFDRLEHLQGHNRTYYTGGLLGYELIETTVAHSRGLIRRCFADEPGGAAAGSAAAAPSAAAEPAATGAAPPAGAPDAAAIQAWLLERVAAQAGEPVDPHVLLDDYLVDSMAVAEVQGELSEWLGFRVSPTLLLELPTVDAVARHLAELLGGRAPEPEAGSGTAAARTA